MMARRFSPEVEARIKANVAAAPKLTPERKAELRRLLLPSANRIRAKLAAGWYYGEDGKLVPPDSQPSP
ncbi:hypothetical protein [uncultured Jatrophihabitans sp.]|uniref:hypothetical protein n=1 Tax=uncultured Jatrophihabitans sp. TaxID=1610747 RepID=UPI0035CBA832